MISNKDSTVAMDFFLVKPRSFTFATMSFLVRAIAPPEKNGCRFPGSGYREVSDDGVRFALKSQRLRALRHNATGESSLLVQLDILMERI
jgi:hypothetical protein